MVGKSNKAIPAGVRNQVQHQNITNIYNKVYKDSSGTNAGRGVGSRIQTPDTTSMPLTAEKRNSIIAKTKTQPGSKAGTGGHSSV